jgi:hypothetical protein
MNNSTANTAVEVHDYEKLRIAQSAPEPADSFSGDELKMPLFRRVAAGGLGTKRVTGCEA